MNQFLEKDVHTAHRSLELLLVDSIDTLELRELLSASEMRKLIEAKLILGGLLARAFVK